MHPKLAAATLFALILCCVALNFGLNPSRAEDDKDPPKDTKARQPVKLTDEALKIHREAIVIDGHNDLPWRLRETDMEFRKIDLNKNQPDFHTDIPRLVKGGVG